MKPQTGICLDWLRGVKGRGNKESSKQNTGQVGSVTPANKYLQKVRDTGEEAQLWEEADTHYCHQILKSFKICFDTTFTFIALVCFTFLLRDTVNEKVNTIFSHLYIKVKPAPVHKL
ncbi:hypothetical protein EXN66_Car012237 [Channa argus]|uniref:Uncharacterized protein n=1 Tax=Channa argus TaxID=215402 RepID=A0A6G1Q267_CHAAH|nr:hypothetical protein EXN66_Car012237 [Channa argus]